jgi:hypothetical protein
MSALTAGDLSFFEFRRVYINRSPEAILCKKLNGRGKSGIESVRLRRFRYLTLYRFDDKPTISR